MQWVRAKNFKTRSRGNLRDLEVEQVQWAIGGAELAGNQMKTTNLHR